MNCYRSEKRAHAVSTAMQWNDGAIQSDTLFISVGNHQADWQQHICELCLAYNSSTHSSTGFTPLFLMFGSRVKLLIDLMYGTNQKESHTTSEYAHSLKDALQEAYTLVRERCQAEHRR